MNTKKKALKKETPTKRKYVKQHTQQVSEVNLQPFEIEVDPPNYRFNPDLVVILRRIDLTMQTLLPGNAFITPAKSKGAIKTYMVDKWPYNIFRFAIIKDNPTMMRVYF